jgi:NAD(P)-dependent dehydrogenase (short-subunit alcohol dehydrogenase family)
VVIGGSGLIGRNVVRRLAAQGHDSVPAAPSTGVDTITREGLADVMEGADVAVDVSNAPVLDDEAVMEFFTTSSRHLMAAERDAGVGHHVAVSIVDAWFGKSVGGSLGATPRSERETAPEDVKEEALRYAPKAVRERELPLAG